MFLVDDYIVVLLLRALSFNCFLQAVCGPGAFIGRAVIEQSNRRKKTDDEAEVSHALVATMVHRDVLYF